MSWNNVFISKIPLKKSSFYKLFQISINNAKQVMYKKDLIISLKK